MQHRIGNYSLLVAFLAILPACDWREPPPRGDSRDFELEVDQLNDRNQQLRDRSEQLEGRLATLAHEVEELRPKLTTTAGEGAREASLELDAKLAEARERVSELRSMTGFDWSAMADAAEEAIDELEEAFDEARVPLETHGSARSPLEDDEAGVQPR